MYLLTPHVSFWCFNMFFCYFKLCIKMLKDFLLFLRFIIKERNENEHFFKNILTTLFSFDL